MQIIIDTVADSPGSIYRVCMWLLSQVTTTPAPAAGTPVEVPKDVTPEKESYTPPPVLGHVEGTGEPIEAPNPAEVFAKVPTGTPSAPIAPAPLPPTLAPEYDTAGVPWDARVHQSGRGKKQDGTWKLKKGLDPAFAAAVLAEITPAAAPAPVATVALVPSVPAPPTLPGSLASVIPPPAPPAAPVVAAPVSSTSGTVTFREVMAKVTAGATSGKLTKVQVDEALVMVGLKADELAPLVLPANADKLANFNALIDLKLNA